MHRLIRKDSGLAGPGCATQTPSPRRTGRASPFPDETRVRLLIPAHGWDVLPSHRASQVPLLIYPRALPPALPEGPASACQLLPTGFRLHPGWQTCHLRIPIEAEPGSLALRRAYSHIPWLRKDGSLHSALVGLHTLLISEPDADSGCAPVAGPTCSPSDRRTTAASSRG